MTRSSIGTRTLAAVKAQVDAVPEWKLAFLRRGAYLSGVLVVLQFVGMWIAALLERPSPTNHALIWGLLFLPTIIPLAVISPEALTSLGKFVAAVMPKFRGGTK